MICACISVTTGSSFASAAAPAARPTSALTSALRSTTAHSPRPSSDAPRRPPPPPPSARRLSGRLLRLSAALGGLVSVLAYTFATKFPTVFTRDPAVLASMGGVAPLLFLALLFHAVCMTSEGLLLGARQLNFLASAYAGCVCVFLSSLFYIARSQLGLGAVWKALAAFQLVRVTVFALRLRTVGLGFTGRLKAADAAAAPGGGDETGPAPAVL